MPSISMYIRISWIVLLCFSVGGSAVAQVDSGQFSEIEDSVQYYQKAGNMKDLLAFLFRQSTFFITADQKELVYEMDKYYDRIANVSEKDKFELRHGLVRHAFNYNRKLGDYNNAQKYYLKAYDYLDDKTNGDSWSWWAENELGNIFSRKGDYEKALKFLKITERQLLSREKKDDKLPRLYTNLGRLYKSKGERRKAESLFLKGLKYGELYDNSLAANHINLAEFYLEENNPEKTQEHIDKLSGLDPTELNERRDLILEIKARILQQQDKHDEADQLFKESILLLKEKLTNPYRRETSKSLILSARNLIEDKQLDEGEKQLDLAPALLNSNIRYIRSWNSR